MANVKHKFLVTDYNGLQVGSATTKKAARRRAQEYADRSGLDCYVYWSERTVFGPQYHASRVRSRAMDKVRRRVFTNGGQMEIGGFNV